jgi:hypothetical protein
MTSLAFGEGGQSQFSFFSIKQQSDLETIWTPARGERWESEERRESAAHVWPPIRCLTLDRRRNLCAGAARDSLLCGGSAHV